jgi:hypothetical protein
MAIFAPLGRRVNSSVLDDPAVRGVIAPAAIERFARAAGHRWRKSYWSPYVTFITFLLQVMDGAKTLRSAVALRHIHTLAGGGNRSAGSLERRLAPRMPADRPRDDRLPSPDPSAYCQARKRLPFEVIRQALRALAERLWDRVEDAATWCGRRVWIVDGSSASMPDTPELQEVFPQPAAQQRGCGFPIAQFVAVFCHATGAIADLTVDSLRPHELTLFRRLWERFAPGDVVLGDRAYGAYTDMAELLTRGVFSVFRLHQKRKVDFRTGLRLGPGDVITVWTRPAQWLASCGLTREQFEQLPAALPVRLVRITHAIKGFRNRTLVVATTLLDPVETPADEIRALYRCRWTAELNLRSLKTHLGMEVLRGKSVEVVAKEIAMHVLVYNLARVAMWRVARQAGCNPQALSFTGTLHRLRHALPLLFLHERPPIGVQNLLRYLVHALACDRLPYRPDRYEPRRVKRRPKPHDLLLKPRWWYHQRMN